MRQVWIMLGGLYLLIWNSPPGLAFLFALATVVAYLVVADAPRDAPIWRAIKFVWRRA